MLLLGCSTSDGQPAWTRSECQADALAGKTAAQLGCSRIEDEADKLLCMNAFEAAYQSSVSRCNRLPETLPEVAATAEAEG